MNNAYGIQNKGTKSFTLIQVVQALSLCVHFGYHMCIAQSSQATETKSSFKKQGQEEVSLFTSITFWPYYMEDAVVFC